MSVIQNIRTKYAKLAGFVIALALVGFILMDAASGGLRDLFGNDSSVASVNGDKIDYTDYQQRVQEYEVLYTYGRESTTLDDVTRAQINEQALQELIRQSVIEDEAEKIGLVSNEAEQEEMIYGVNADPAVRNYMIQGVPAFVNQETGMFEPQRVKMFEQQAMQIDPSGKLLQQWETVKSYIVRSNLERKYTAMITSAAYMPKFVMQSQLKDQNNYASIDYVAIPYSVIPDGEVKVTDAELKDYMKKNEERFSNDQPTRSIEYVSFDVVPSTGDTASVMAGVSTLKENFATAESAENFVNRNSDESYMPLYASKKNFMSPYSDSILAQPVGSVFGPYFENGNFKLTKIISKETLPDSVRVRHILVKTEDRRQAVMADSAAKNKVDSLVNAINGGAAFAEIVAQFSDDEGSKNTGGEYTFSLQQRSNLSKEFADFAFEGSKGQKKVVKVENPNYSGYHYIEILDQMGVGPVTQLATVTKALYPSGETENALYAKASEFAGKYNTAKQFDEGVQKEGLNKRLAENIEVNDFMLPGLGASREIIRWVYKEDVGSVSPVFAINDKYIVVKIAGKKDKGLIDLSDNNRPQIEAAVRNEKKAEKIKAKYTNPQSLQMLSQTAGQPLQSADSFNFASTFVQNLGYDAKVVGYTFYSGFKPNTVSPPLAGDGGVMYITKKNTWTKGLENVNDQMLQNMATSKRVEMKNGIANYLNEALRKKAEIEYNAENL